MKHRLRTLPTLEYAAKIYLVYLRSLNITPRRFVQYVRVLRHVMLFYGPTFCLDQFYGSRVLQYADLYDPWHENPLMRERGEVFWKFIHWMKKNEMIPAFTAKEQ